MSTKRHLIWAVIAAACTLLGCAGSVLTKAPLSIPPGTRTIEEHILYAPTTWSGAVRIVKPLVVTKSAALRILPGTTVFFDLPEPSPKTDRQPWILVLGSVVAAGSAEQPIAFRSVTPRQSELDDMIQIQAAPEAHFRHCTFERGPWGLHIHETDADILDCVFRDNYGGVRFQGGRVVLRGNRFEHNSLGVRCLKCSPALEENTFVRNATGVFFREGVDGAVVRRNNFDDTEYDFKLGEGQTTDVDASQNWWGSPGRSPPDERIYDGSDSPGIGRVRVDSPLSAPWGQEAKSK